MPTWGSEQEYEQLPSSLEYIVILTSNPSTLPSIMSLQATKNLKTLYCLNAQQGQWRESNSSGPSMPVNWKGFKYWCHILLHIQLLQECPMGGRMFENK